MTFDQTPVKVVNVIQLLDDSPYKTFDMVSIDAEGLDWAILRQMPLSLMGTKLIVIEYGEHGDQILDYCYDFKVLMRNGENLILAK